MKKILWFSLSLGLSFLGFALVIFLCYFLSNVEKKSVQNEDDPKSIQPYVLDVMVLFADEPTDRYFASVLTLDAKNNIVTAKTLDTNTQIGNKTLVEIYKTEGLYPFADACNKAVGKAYLKFIKLNSKSFVNYADRLGKIVYNNKNIETLLTSQQAERQLCDESFTEICIMVGQKAILEGVEQEFLYVTSVAENNLSYPIFYDKTHQVGWGI